jgi:Cys-rich repeat protein
VEGEFVYNRPTMQRLSYLQWFYASVLAVACANTGGEPKAPGKAQGCDTSNPCPSGQACIDAQCKASGCTSDGDCGGQAACIEGACSSRECQASISCLGDDETAGTADDRSCVGGVCLFISCPRDGDRCPGPGKEKCAWNSDCGSGRVCFNGTCTSGRCTNDKDCTPRFCHLGLCLDRECDANKPCTKGRACVQGLCIPQPAAASNSERDGG